MKRILRVSIFVIFVAVATSIGTLLVFKRYHMAVLSPRELAVRQPIPPQLPADCPEIRRAVALSTQSVSSGRERPIKITSPLDSDEIAIYVALIEQWNSGQRNALNVSAKTSPFGSISSLDEQGCGCLSGLAAESLLRASHSFHVLTPNDLSAANIRLFDPEKQMAIVAENDPGRTMHKGIPVTEAVENGFANGLFSLSEIAFDEKRRLAVVSYGFRCGMLCGNGATWVFEKVDGKWKKTNRECGSWIS